MDRVFYEVIPGSPVFDFCEQHAAEHERVKKAYADFAERHGAKGWTEGFTRLRGLVFAYGAQIPDALKKERRGTSDGKDVYTPRARTPEGKAIAKDIDALPELPSADVFAKRFEIPTSLRYAGGDCITGSMRLSPGFSINSVLIGWTKPGSYWVVLPDIDAGIANAKERYDTVEPSSWTVLEGLKRSTEARYGLAIAQAKVDEEASA